MNESNSFASLGPMLLARKGTAKPAMRAQLGANDRTDILGDDLAELADSESDLGWNDMGDTLPAEDNVTPIRPSRRKNPRLQGAIERETGHDARPHRPGTPRRHGNVERRRAAFTLRLDAERHFKLRLASTITEESAQKLVTEALDRFLDEMPELDLLAAQARHSSDKS